MTFTAHSVVSHVGKVRANNQDSAYSGTYLHVVADGMGGHAGGDVASALTINRLKELDHPFETAQEAVDAFQHALLEANRALSMTVVDYPEITGMGTTVSGMIIVGDQAAICHIGDSRIYRYRGGQLTQQTKDHTFVQRLVDSGRITPEEALVHPRRSVIMRVLGDIDANPEIDTAIVDLEPGDRWLLCSDGLSGPVHDPEIDEILHDTAEPARATARLVQAALQHGAPDNVTVLVLEPLVPGEQESSAKTVGSAAAPLTLEPLQKALDTKGSLLPHLRIPTLRSAPLEPTHFEPRTDEFLNTILAENHARQVRRNILAAVTAVLIVGGIVAAGIFGYRWTQTRYYIGESNGVVTVFQGVSTKLGPITLSHEVDDPSLPVIKVDQIAFDSQVAVSGNIPVASLDEARAKLEALAREVTTSDDTDGTETDQGAAAGDQE